MRKLLAVVLLFTLISFFPACPGSSGGNDNQTGFVHIPKVCIAWTEQDGSSINQLYVKCKDGDGAWSELGGGGSLNSNPAIGSNNPSLAQDSQGWPYVAWEENGAIYVKHWNNDMLSWDPFGFLYSSMMIARTGVIQAPAVVGNVYNPDISVGHDGTVAIAYYDSASGAQVFVRKWSGSTWDLVGSTYLNNDGANYLYDFSLDVQDASNMYVVYSELNTEAVPYNEIYVKRLNGTVWEAVGTGMNVGGNYAGSPQIELDGNGTPLVTFKESNNVYVRYWSGAAWQPVGGQLNTLGSWTYPQMALDSTGLPYVLWGENYNLYVKHWDGATWQNTGTGPLNVVTDNYVFDSGFSVTKPLSAFDTGVPFAVWVEYSSPVSGIRSKFFDGSTWQGGANLNIDPAKSSYGVGISAQ